MISGDKMINDFIVIGAGILTRAAGLLCANVVRTPRTWAWELLSVATEVAAFEAREELTEEEHAQSRRRIDSQARHLRRCGWAHHAQRAEGSALVRDALAHLQRTESEAE